MADAYDITHLGDRAKLKLKPVNLFLKVNTVVEEGEKESS